MTDMTLAKLTNISASASTIIAGTLVARSPWAFIALLATIIACKALDKAPDIIRAWREPRG